MKSLQEQFPPGTLFVFSIPDKKISVLILSWKGRLATIMFQDGYIATCYETSILHFSELDNTQVLFPHQPEQP